MIQVYMSLNGNTEEAIAYYAQAFNGEVGNVMKFSDLPPEDKINMPPGSEKLVLFAEVKTFAGVMMMSDMMPGTQVIPNESVWISVSSLEEARIREAFGNLAKDGEIIMPFEKTFFSPLYGQVKDKFGFYWMLMVE